MRTSHLAGDGGRWLAAITFSEHGGGVAQVSRVMWEVLRRRWSDSAGLLTLMDDGVEEPSPRADLSRRVGFGLRAAHVQARRSSRWMLFSHLGLARVQAYLPTAMQVPYAVFLHGVEAWKPLRPSERTALRRAALRIANSQTTADRFLRRNPEVGRVDVCPLALPPTAPGPGSPPAEDPDMLPSALIVGRMDSRERYKGHDQLLEVWPGVIARVPGARLTIVGEGDDAPRLRSVAAARGLDRHVTFVGFLSPERLDAAYRAASVFAMPSRGEGFGLAYIEAMSHGLPCIGSTDDAAAEVIADGETGFLVPQSDRTALTQRLVLLLTDASVRVRMGLNALRTVRERYTFDRFASRLESLIAERLEPPGCAS